MAIISLCSLSLFTACGEQEKLTEENKKPNTQVGGGSQNAVTTAVLGNVDNTTYGVVPAIQIVL